MSSEVVVPLLVALIGSGGVIGGIVAFLKLRPEKDSIVVTAAQGALLVQAGIVETLRQELARATARLEACEGHQDRIEELEREVERSKAMLDEKDLKITSLEYRIEELEGR